MTDAPQSVSTGSAGLPTASAMKTALGYMRSQAAGLEKLATTVSGSGEGAEIYRDAVRCIEFAMRDVAQAAPDALIEAQKCIARETERCIRLEMVIRDSIEALERNSTSAPVVECLKAALASRSGDLAYDAGNCGAVRAALFEPERSDAYDNLEGALIDIERFGSEGKPTDDVCIRTIRRVLAQLAAAKRALTLPSTQDQTARCEHGAPANACTICHMWSQMSSTHYGLRK